MTMHTSTLRSIAAAVLASVAVPGNSLAWGKTGHAVVADIAEAHLTNAAAAQVKLLLGVEGMHHLADISSWADKAKAEGLEGSPSHTIRLPLDNTPRRNIPARDTSARTTRSSDTVPCWPIGNARSRSGKSR